MPHVSGPVTVEVPATSANLGPGFDCLGLALELHDTLTAEVVSSGSHIEVVGEGAEEVPLDETHLVVRAMRAAFDVLGEQPAGLELRCTNRIPHSRGMGSSSAAIVGGIVLARELVEGGAERLDDTAALALANQLEGHPDNVAPALLGGFVISGYDATSVWAQRSPVDPGIEAVVLVPPFGVHTGVARGLLPDAVSHADATANTGRAALLVAALAGQPDLLWRATEDFLHQRYREAVMPDSVGLVRTLREAGVAAVISGAGPTVLAFVVGDADPVLALAPTGWRAMRQVVGGPGARVLA